MDRHVAAYRRQVVGEADVVGALQELAPRGALDLLGVGQQLLDAAVLGEELLRALLPYALTAGDVVDLVPEESKVVDDLAGVL